MIFRNINSDYYSCRGISLGWFQRAWIIVPALIYSLFAVTGLSIADEGSAKETAPAAETSPAPESVPWLGPVQWLGPILWLGPFPWQEDTAWEEYAPWPRIGPYKALVPRPPKNNAFGRTIDKTHAMLERKILKQTVRFDNFFGSVKPEILRQTKYNIRWRSSLRIEDGQDLNTGTSLSASFALSKINERLRLFIAGEDEPGQTTQSLPQDPGSPGFDRTSPATHFVNTELRYEFIKTPTLNIFMGTGVRLALPFEVFARSRLQYVRNLSDISLMRIGETFFAKNTDYFGETTEFSLERLFGKTTLLRWGSAATTSKVIKGLEWGSELSLSHELSSESAMTLKGGVYGNSESAYLVNNYLLLARYRRSFLRSWLFFELEPQVSWPRNQEGSSPAVVAVTIRLEVAFQGTTAY